MKNIFLTIGFILFITACSDDNNNSNPRNPPIDNNPSLSETASRSLETIKWCEIADVTYKTYECNGIVIRHKFTKFSNTEYLAEIIYDGGGAYCGKGSIHLTSTDIQKLFEKASYRVSFTEKNKAVITQVGSDTGEPVEFFVDSKSVITIPNNKALAPNRLEPCK